MTLTALVDGFVDVGSSADWHNQLAPFVDRSSVIRLEHQNPKQNWRKQRHSEDMKSSDGSRSSLAQFEFVLRLLQLLHLRSFTERVLPPHNH